MIFAGDVVETNILIQTPTSTKLSCNLVCISHDSTTAVPPLHRTMGFMDRLRCRITLHPLLFSEQTQPLCRPVDALLARALLYRIIRTYHFSDLFDEAFKTTLLKLRFRAPGLDLKLIHVPFLKFIISLFEAKI